MSGKSLGDGSSDNVAKAEAVCEDLTECKTENGTCAKGCQIKVGQELTYVHN